MSKEIPFFKFHSAEWLTGDISLENFRTQGMFIAICAEYWQRDCTLTLKCVKKRLKLNQKSVETLLKLDLISIQNDHVFIKFLDEQFRELSENHRKRVESGRKGGKQSSSNASSNAQAPLKHLDKDIEEEVDKKTVFQIVEKRFGIMKTVDCEKILSLKVPDDKLEEFEKAFNSVFDETGAKYRSPVSIAQKAFAEYGNSTSTQEHKPKRI